MPSVTLTGNSGDDGGAGNNQWQGYENLNLAQRVEFLSRMSKSANPSSDYTSGTRLSDAPHRLNMTDAAQGNMSYIVNAFGPGGALYRILEKTDRDIVRGNEEARAFHLSVAKAPALIPYNVPAYVAGYATASTPSNALVPYAQGGQGTFGGSGVGGGAVAARGLPYLSNFFGLNSAPNAYDWNVRASVGGANDGGAIAVMLPRGSPILQSIAHSQSKALVPYDNRRGLVSTANNGAGVSPYAIIGAQNAAANNVFNWFQGSNASNPNFPGGGGGGGGAGGGSGGGVPPIPPTAPPPLVPRQPRQGFLSGWNNRQRGELGELLLSAPYDIIGAFGSADRSLYIGPEQYAFPAFRYSQGGAFGGLGGTVGGVAGGVLGAYFGGPGGMAIGAGIGSAFGGLVGGLGGFFHGRSDDERYSAIREASEINASAALSRPYTDFLKSTYAIGRSRGVLGEDVFHQFISNIDDKGKITADPRLGQLLLSAPGALDILSRFGIGAPSAAGDFSTVAGIRQAQLMPGFAMVPGQAVTAFSRRLQGMGVLGGFGQFDANNPTSAVPETLMQVGGILQSAAIRNQDTMEILKSIDRATSYMAASRNPVSAPATFDFLGRMMQGGSPQARTGELGLGAAEGVRSSIANAFGSPYGSYVMTRAYEEAGDRSSLARLLGGGNLQEGQKLLRSLDPQSQKLVNDYLRMRQNPQDRMVAMSLLQQLLPTNSAGWIYENQRIARELGFDPTASRYLGYRGAGLSALEGVTYDGTRGAPVGAAQMSQGANNPLNLTYAPGQQGITGTYTVKDSTGTSRTFGRYMSMPAGIASDLKQLWQYQSQGVKTVRQLVSKWVGGGASPAVLNGYINDVAKAVGVSPDTPIDLHDATVASKYLAAAAKHETGPLNPADIQSGIALAQSGTVLPSVSGPFPNVPSAAYGPDVSAQNEQLTAAISNVVTFADTLGAAGTAVEQFTRRLNEFMQSGNGAPNVAMRGAVHALPHSVPVPHQSTQAPGAH